MSQHRFPSVLSLVCAGLLLAFAPLAPAQVVAQVFTDANIKTSPGKKMEVRPGVAGVADARPEGKAEAKGEAHADAKADPHAVAKREPPKPIDPMTTLRERLAQKLGAKPADDKSPYVMHVSTHEPGETVISAPRPSSKAVAAAKAAPAAHGAGNDDHAATAAAHAGPAHWDYAGEAGPESWAAMKPEFATCAAGKRQSPIDIRGGIQVDLEPVKFDYRPSNFSVIDNGHTVQVNIGPGNSIMVTGRRYDLVQFHFHRPSEERINGRQFDMVAHLVHKDVDGRLAVVAVLLDRGSAHALVQTIWNNLPLEKGDEVPASTQIDLNRLLPEDRRYYTYMGSLTTPPCSEGVLWMVMKQPVPISPEQVSIFARLYPMNARPIQQASGRLIKESN